MPVLFSPSTIPLTLGEDRQFVAAAQIVTDLSCRATGAKAIYCLGFRVRVVKRFWQEQQKAARSLHKEANVRLWLNRYCRIRLHHRRFNRNPAIRDRRF